MITNEDLKKIITILSRIYIFNPDKRIRGLIVRLLKMRDKGRPSVTDLRNAFGRVLYPEKKKVSFAENMGILDLAYVTSCVREYEEIKANGNGIKTF